MREPLHDEVLSSVFRIEGNKIGLVEDQFKQTVLQSQLHPIKSSVRLDDWMRTLRGHWFQHKAELEKYLGRKEAEMGKVFAGRASAALKRELEAAKESYRYRLKELQDRSREQELTKVAKELLRQQAEATQPTLFEEIKEEAKFRVQELEEQMTVLRQDVERTRDLLEKERKHRTEIVLPKRFQIREVRVLPLALTYIVPATAEDVKP